jgi:uncharacterized protein
MNHFDPFSDRFSRKIRNDLSEALMTSLRQLDLTPAREVADHYITSELQPKYRQYIDARMTSYQRALELIRSNHIEDPFDRALVLWDEGLFFEVHEILEQVWLKASGTTKLILQAMIRAAGMYVQLDHGNTKGASSMAAKAVAVLESNRKEIPDGFDIDLLLTRLKDVDPVPPKLMERKQ